MIELIVFIRHYMLLCGQRHMKSEADKKLARSWTSPSAFSDFVLTDLWDNEKDSTYDSL
jgi:hypothetical protein